MTEPRAAAGVWPRVLRWLWRRLGLGPASETASGREGERLAARYLRGQGMTILGANVRLARGEIDILARDGDALVVVEVKSGTDEGAYRPSVHIGPDKRRRLVALAEMAQKERGLIGCPLRIDVVEVIWQAGRAAPVIRHHPAAVSDESRGQHFRRGR